VLKDMTAAQIVLAILGVGALIAWHELGHYALARLTGMRVLKFSVGFGPKLWSFVKNDIEYRLSAIPLGGYVQIAGMSPLEPGALEDPRSFIFAPRWARIATIAAGPAFNYVLAFFLLWVFFFSWPGGMVVLDEVKPGSPAAEAGLVAGDRVYGAGGRRIRNEAQFIERLSSAEKTSLYVMRADEKADDGQRETEVTLAAGKGADAAQLGLSWRFEDNPVGLGESAVKAGVSCWKYSVTTLVGLGKLFQGDKDVQASGPPGIVKELTSAVQRGAPDFIWLLAVLSITLGLLNLLPIPALDGIKIVFLTIEGIIRRELNPYVQLWVNAIGLLLLLGLIMVLSVSDVLKMMG
jgi:regulator of sigma E protease